MNKSWREEQLEVTEVRFAKADFETRARAYSSEIKVLLFGAKSRVAGFLRMRKLASGDSGWQSLCEGETAEGFAGLRPTRISTFGADKSTCERDGEVDTD
jgi:hypothetical protein